MKEFIILTTIAGYDLAIRPSSIISIEEEETRILVITETWYISDEKHSVSGIVEEVSRSKQ